MDKWTNGLTEKQTTGQIDNWPNRQMNKQTNEQADK